MSMCYGCEDGCGFASRFLPLTSEKKCPNCGGKTSSHNPDEILEIMREALDVKQNSKTRIGSIQASNN